MRRSAALLHRSGNGGRGRAQCPRRSQRPGGYGARQRDHLHSLAAPRRLVPHRAGVRPDADLGLVVDRSGAAVPLLGLLPMKTLLLVGVAAIAFASASHAANPKMAVEFVGDWCLADVEPDGQRLNYRLPSWMGGEPCDRILSIDQWGLSDSNSQQSCSLARSMRVKANQGHTGVFYEATITLSCYGSLENKTKIRVFKFERYKGNLWVTERPTQAPVQDR
jgi:hypothetical protein